MAGCLWRHGMPTRRKRPIAEDDIIGIINVLGASQEHDHILFLSMLTTGRDGLLRLGELTISDTVARRNADRYYEGNTIIIQYTNQRSDPLIQFSAYLTSRD
ncbi:hypothetical protein C8F01DRAFT_1255763 [Mycena amicta]|nr:hypothetical protein C8F01DRAFT_1255763 [Mycena amicta]